jgi:hypothetical protein
MYLGRIVEVGDARRACADDAIVSFRAICRAAARGGTIPVL